MKYLLLLIFSIPAFAQFGAASAVVSGTGAPNAAQCVSANNVGRVYARKDGAAANTTLYVCSNTAPATYAWALVGAAGGGATSVTAGATGALVISPTTGAVVADIDTAYVPAKTASNTFTGTNSFTSNNTEIKHLIAIGTAPTIASGFGTTPSIAGKDMAGKVTVGTGGTASTGSILFNVAYTTAPSCVANNQTSQIYVQATPTTTNVVLSSSSAWGAADVISWICVGY